MQQHVDWALENVPMLATYDQQAVRQIVARAINDTHIVRLVLSIGLTVLFALSGSALEAEILNFTDSKAGRYAVLLLAGTVGGLIGLMVGNEILRRRLEHLVSGI